MPAPKFSNGLAIKVSVRELTRYTKSSHTHNLAKSQNYQGLKFILSDTKFMIL